MSDCLEDCFNVLEKLSQFLEISRSKDKTYRRIFLLSLFEVGNDEKKSALVRAKKKRKTQR